MIGIVTWFNVPKGYGELYSESGETFFFTYLELPKIQKFRTIERGTLVEFEESSSERHFGLVVAKKIRNLKRPEKLKNEVVEQLKGVLA